MPSRVLDGNLVVKSVLYVLLLCLCYRTSFIAEQLMTTILMTDRFVFTS